MNGRSALTEKYTIGTDSISVVIPEKQQAIITPRRQYSHLLEDFHWSKL